MRAKLAEGRCVEGNKATRSPEISRQQVQKLTPPPLYPGTLIYIPNFYLLNFMLKFPIYYLEKPLPITSKWRGVTVRKWKVEHQITIKHEMTKNCFFSKKIIKFRPPPPPPPPITYTTPHPWDQKSEQGNGGYIGYIFPLSLSTIWGNHLPLNFMLKFLIYYLEKHFP